MDFSVLAMMARVECPVDDGDERLYRATFEHALDATVVVDDDGRMLHMNRAARDLMGIDLEQAFASTPAGNADVASFRTHLRTAGRAEGEVPIPDARGETRRLRLTGRAQGRHYVVVARDVTERCLRDQELQQYRRHEAAGLLTASIIDGLNDALTAIACTSVLLSRITHDRARSSEVARELASAVQHAAQLTRRVHSVLRRAPSPPESLDLSEALHEAQPLVQGIVGEGVDVRVEPSSEVASVVVERARLQHALLQLAVDAREAMPRGGTLVMAVDCLSAGDSGSRRGAGEQGEYVVLRVTDTGTGGAPPGGFRLASVRAFVAESGGRMAVRGAFSGAGTTVLLYLPRARKACTAPRPVILEAEPLGGSEQILVIEPDDRARRAMRLVLASVGYGVIDAPTAEMGVRLAERFARPTALVVAPGQAREPASRRVVERLRAAGHPARLLATTGLRECAPASRGGAAEPALRKVFSRAGLLRAVRDALDAPSPPSGAGESERNRAGEREGAEDRGRRARPAAR